MDDSPRRIFSQAVEDYLKIIYKLQEEHEIASTTAIARRMGSSPAAATKMIKYLAELSLLEHAPYQGARLTRTGERVALEIIRHHRLLELYLHRALGYGWDEVDAEAEKLEHHISEEFEDRIERLLDFPSEDPHGEPIPTREGAIGPRRGTSLAEAEPGAVLVIRRVNDDSPDVLRYLSGIGIRLGAHVHVLEKQPFNGPITVAIGESVTPMGRELAGHVFVEPAGATP
jgi:DtxR family Mn-dependent transcriptional regulator